MNIDKVMRLYFLILVAIATSLLPIFMEFHYVILYYVVLGIIIPLSVARNVRHEKYEQRFIERWDKDREKGFWFNFFKIAVFSFFYMLLVAFFVQLVAYGYTPIDIYLKLSVKDLFVLLGILVVFSVIGGIVSWFEKNKRYNRIVERMEREQDLI